MKSYKYKKGMTIYIAVVVMGILLLISFAVLGITLKGTMFATFGRDSQFAFYAADSILECAIYWDTQVDPSAFATATPGTISCANNLNITSGQPLPGLTGLSRVGGGGSNPQSIFGLVFTSGGSNPVNACAHTTVNKNANGTTLIRARGFNTCDINNLRRVERGIEVNY